MVLVGELVTGMMVEVKILKVVDELVVFGSFANIYYRLCSLVPFSDTY